MSTLNNKKALSNMVAYVLLISITIALSVLVYNWLRFYVSAEEVPACSAGVSLIINDYECFPGQRLIIDLKNKGRFSIDGFTLRIHNRTGATFGFYTINETGAPIAPGGELQTIGNLSGPAGTFSQVTLIEIQPYVMDGEKISCRSIATQSVSC